MKRLTLRIPRRDAEFLRRVFEMALDGIRDELESYPEDLREPTHLGREEGIYAALLAALDGESIAPDRHLREVLRDLAEMIDRENEYERVVAEHAALLGLHKQICEGGA
jgi:hypothetical protein